MPKIGNRPFFAGNLIRQPTLLNLSVNLQIRFVWLVLYIILTM